MVAASELKAMNEPFKNPKFIFFTDFDGTITMKDTNDYMTDNIGFGSEKRKAGNASVLDGSRHFRDAFRDMMDSIKTPFPDCIDLLVKEIKLDPHFNEYFQWALANGIPTVVLSGGMEPIIRAVLKNLVGPDHVKIDIVSNQVGPREGMTIEQEGGWQILYHDESGFGHDKSMTLRPYAQLPEGERPTMFYAGDGVSDLSAARESDLLFAKEGHQLIDYCVREKVPFTVFRDWSSILQSVKDITSGKITVQDAARQGVEEFEASKQGNGHAK